MFVNSGIIVSIWTRNFVLLPQEDPNIYLFRPLIGAMNVGIASHKGPANLIGYTLPMERLTLATFPLPLVDDLSDAASVHLLWQAARLTLREGASPLRSLGRIPIR
jgi:hypothetical protein